MNIGSTLASFIIYPRLHFLYYNYVFIRRYWAPPPATLRDDDIGAKSSLKKIQVSRRSWYVLLMFCREKRFHACIERKNIVAKIVDFRKYSRTAVPWSRTDSSIVQYLD